MNGYAVTAQFYDVMADDQHSGVDAQIAAALAGLDTTAGPVADIGAGTGLTTRVIATTLPDAEILAIEPDAAMRPALTARVWSDLDLRRRVSILPMGIMDAPLPATIAGAVLSASLVHFSPEERVRLWALLADRLVAGGRVIVEVQCPLAVAIPEMQMGSGRVGRVEYEGRVSAELLDEQRQRWCVTYRTVLDGRELACDRATYDCWTISADQIAAEATAAGLVGRSDGELVILEPR